MAGLIPKQLQLSPNLRRSVYRFLKRNAKISVHPIFTDAPSIAQMIRLDLKLDRNAGSGAIAIRLDTVSDPREQPSLETSSRRIDNRPLHDPYP